MLRACALLLLLALDGAPAPRPPSPEAAVRAVVARLVAQPPRRLSELEAAVGPLARDPGVDWISLMRERPALAVRFVSTRFDLDLYEVRPEEVADPPLAEWLIVFEGGHAALLDELRRRAGPPRRFQTSQGPRLAFGALLVDADPSRLAKISWLGQAPPPTPAPPPGRRTPGRP